MDDNEIWNVHLYVVKDRKTGTFSIYGNTSAHVGEIFLIVQGEPTLNAAFEALGRKV
jgi:hypothetical protein